MRRKIIIVFVSICVIGSFYAGNRWIISLGKREVYSETSYNKYKEKTKKAERRVKKREKVITERREKERAPLHLVLLGTIVKGSSSLARIKDEISGYEAYYKVGDRIKNLLLVKIGYAEVEFLKKDGSKEVLRVVGFSPEEKVFREIEKNRRIVHKDALLAKFPGFNHILGELSVSPEVSKGEMKGFRLERIKENSLISQAGFREGDIVRKIEGYALKSPFDVFKIYQRIKEDYKKGLIKSIEVEVERGKKREKLIYQIE